MQHKQSKVKYKIISYTSQQSQFPVSNLFIKDSGGWQSQRFCTYPQQITLQLYARVRIKQIQIRCKNRKLSEQIDILYYPQTQLKMKDKFVKFTSINLTSLQKANQGDSKKCIAVDFVCQYLRLLFHKNIPKRQNFFSQVSLTQLNIITQYQFQNQTTQSNPIPLTHQSNINFPNTNSVSNKILFLQNLKVEAVNLEKYKQAKTYKSIINQVKNLDNLLYALNLQKKQAILYEDYDKAETIKIQIDNINQIVNSAIQHSLKTRNKYIQTQNITNRVTTNTRERKIKTQRSINDEQGELNSSFKNKDLYNNQIKIGNDNKGEPIIQIKNDKIILSREKYEQSRILKNQNSFKKSSKQKSPKDNSKQKKSKNEQYNKSLQYREFSQVEQSPPGLDQVQNQNMIKQLDEQDGMELPKESQPINPKYLKQISVFKNVFQQNILKNIYSRYWQFRLQGLKSIIVDIKNIKTNKKNNMNSIHQMKIRFLLTILARLIGDRVAQIIYISLQILDQILNLDKQISKDLIKKNQLQNIIIQIICKLGQTNRKIRMYSQNLFYKMIKSNLFGIQNCSIGLINLHKKKKISTKLYKLSINYLTQLIISYGIGNNKVSINSLDYAVELLSNKSNQVRNAAMQLLVKATKNVDQSKIRKYLEDLDPQIQQIIEKKIDKAELAMKYEKDIKLRR